MERTKDPRRSARGNAVDTHAAIPGLYHLKPIYEPAHRHATVKLVATWTE